MGRHRRRSHGADMHNARFRPRPKRRPRSLTGTHYYCPTMLTKHPDLARNETLCVVSVPSDLADTSVEVRRYDDYSLTPDTFNVFWRDLRK